jgi:peptide/nickel transport system permease protein
LLHGNLGDSLTLGLSVNTLLRRALPPTLSLMIGGMILWLVTGTLVGTVSALRPGSWADRTATGATLSAMINPTFLLALLLLDLSTYLARSGYLWTQPGYVPFTYNPVQWLGRMILPWIAVAATQAAVTAKLTRSAVLDVLGEQEGHRRALRGVLGVLPTRMPKNASPQADSNRPPRAVL